MKNQERGPVSAAAAIMPFTATSDRLSQLFAEHHRRVLLAAYRITGSMADAEDVAQTVFLRLGQGESLDLKNAASYLYRASINGALDLLRRRKTAAAEPLEAARPSRQPHRAIRRKPKSPAASSPAPAPGHQRTVSARRRDVHPALPGRSRQPRNRGFDGYLAGCRRCHAASCPIQAEETTHGVRTGKPDETPEKSC